MGAPPALAAAEDSCSQHAGHFASVEGNVEFQRTGSREWKSATLNGSLCQNDAIRVGQNSRAVVSLINEAVLRLKQNTTIRLLDITDKEEEKSLLEIITGVIQSFSRI